MSQYIAEHAVAVHDENAQENIATSLRLLDQSHEYEALIAAAQDAYVFVHSRADLVILLAQAHAKTGDSATTATLLAAADASSSSKGGPLEALIKLSLVMGEVEQARTYLQQHEARYPKRAAFRKRTMREHSTFRE